MKVKAKGTILLAAAWLTVSSVSAATIYDNSQTDLNLRFNPGLIEIGDEVTFAGTDRLLTSFSFEYYGLSTLPGTFAGNVQAKVRFYNNDGGLVNNYASPGTSFYDSDWFTITPTSVDGRSVLTFTPGSDNIPAEGLILPDSMTFSVQFQGLGAGDEAGIDSYGPVAVGSSFNDYWEYTGGAWHMKENSAGAINFAAVFEAVPVPEPASALLLAMGMIAFVAVRRK